MATPTVSTSSARPQRYSADQARILFENLLMSDSEIEDSDDDYHETCAKESKKSRQCVSGLASLAGACFQSGTISTSSSSDEETDSEEKNDISLLPNIDGDATTRKKKFTKSQRTMPDDDWREALNGESIGESRFRGINSGSRLDQTENISPLQCLLSLLTGPIVDNLITNVNAYAEQKQQRENPFRKFTTLAKWTPLDRNLFLHFLAAFIGMGLNKKNAIKDYWSTKAHRESPWFRAMFSRTKFLLIFQSMLHVAVPDAQGVCKIQSFVDELVASFQKAFYPFENICVDEMVIGFKGRFRYRQYNASKPKKYHIKAYGLCDSITGYVYNLLPYFGAETAYKPETDLESSHAVNVFETLLQGITGHHHLFADRYYSSLPLIQFLKKKNHHYTGTLNSNRRGFPSEMKNHKIAVNQAKWFVNDAEGIMCLSWRDKKSKKPCQVVTTCGSATYEVKMERRSQIEKPSPIHSYNISMNGCDRVDQIISYYGNHTRKTVKWWKKIFMWVIEITQVNAHILYTLSRPHTEKPMPFADFKDILIEQLCKLVGAEAPNSLQDVLLSKPGRKSKNLELERYQGATHLIDFDGKDLQCVHCAAKKVRKRSSFYCTGCSHKPHLCPKSCFRKYHTA